MPTELRISVENGNLRFVRQPLLLGHYAGTSFSGSEALVDTLLKGAMTKARQLQDYPGAIKSHAVFVNPAPNPADPLRIPLPAAAVIVGLGEEGALRPGQLCETVCQGVLGFVQRARERDGNDALELATTLMGTGGPGMSVGTAAQFIARGVVEANRRLNETGDKGVGCLRIVELYLDRAREAHTALSADAQAARPPFTLEREIDEGSGPLDRPLSANYRPVRYDFVSALCRAGQEDTLEFVIDTQRARSELSAHSTELKSVRALVEGAIQDRKQLSARSQALFRSLVPQALESFLVTSPAVLLELDEGSASLPWEILDPTLSDPAHVNHKRLPWSIQCKLLRRLRTAKFKEKPMTGHEGAALVIGAPICPASYADLPGARAEANAVLALFAGGASRMKATPLVSKAAIDLTTAIATIPCTILHVSGHGKLSDKGGGVVLSDGSLLGATAFGNMPRIPEIVFINCCFIGNVGDRFNQPSSGATPKFASTLAKELIEIGVRCVIAAGWAVADKPAAMFAEVLYRELLKNLTYADAVASARRDVYENYPTDNTWAAYQCYGDPDYRLFGTELEANDTASIQGTERILSASDLMLVLRATAEQVRAGRGTAAGHKQNLARLAEEGKRWTKQGDVAEAFATTYVTLADARNAIFWYEQAMQAKDARVSLKALEQLGNWLARHAAECVLATGQAPTADVLAQAHEDLSKAQRVLDQLCTIGETSERLNLLGSLEKRRAMVELVADQTVAAQAAIVRMEGHYLRAEQLARARGDTNLHYPALNRLSASVVRGFAAADVAVSEDEIANIRENLVAVGTQKADFWNLVAVIELEIYTALASRQLAAKCDDILKRYGVLLTRIGAYDGWASVRDHMRFVLLSYKKMGQEEQAEKTAADAILAWLEARNR